MKSAHSPIAAEEVLRYERDGYLLPNRPLFDEQAFAGLESLFSKLLQTYGPDDLDTIHFREPALLPYLLSDDVLDVVEPLIGPNIGLWSSHFICKPARTGKATPWHEDGAYWDGRISTMENIVTVWLAMDYVDAENGAIQVIPGTHKDGLAAKYRDVSSDENIFSEEIDPSSVDESQAVTFSLEPNMYSLHDARIIHGAPANTSDRRRAGFTMRYFSTDSTVVPERNTGHKIWLARGENRGGNQFVND